jgi:hypothetical protein
MALAVAMTVHHCGDLDEATKVGVLAAWPGLAGICCRLCQEHEAAAENDPTPEDAEMIDDSEESNPEGYQPFQLDDPKFPAIKPSWVRGLAAFFSEYDRMLTEP